MDNQIVDSTRASGANPNVPEASSSKASRYLVLLIATLLVSGGLIFYFYKTLAPVAIDSVIEEIAQDPPSGAIILTATLDGIPSVFTLDLGIEDSLFYKYPSDFDTTIFPEFTNKINAEKVFFVGSTPESEGEVDKLGLSSWMVGVEGVPYYGSAAGNVERDLNWSEAAGKLAFYRVKESAEIPVDTIPAIDDHEIVIIDPEQNAIITVVDGGIYPRWSPDGKSFLFLKDDGFYEYNLDKSAETKVMSPDPSGVTLTSSEMFDVSPDGKRMIITSQNSGLITMLEVSFWNPPTIALEYTFADEGMHFSQPLFSPDGTKFAILTYDRAGEEFSNPRLEIRDAETAEILLSRPVDAFDMRQFFISDWIAKPVMSEGGISNSSDTQ